MRLPFVISPAASAVLGVAVCCLSASAAAPTPAASPARPTDPSIQFDSTNYNFGEVLAGEPAKHTYTFTNTGAGELIISNVLTGCGCTKAGDWTRRAQPGETGVVPVQLNTDGFFGAVDKTVTISCNDPSRKTMSLRLKGVVRRAMEIHPSTAWLSLPPDVPFGTATIRITNCLAGPLGLSAPRSTNGLLGAELRTNLPGREYVLTVSNTAALPAGTFTAGITLRTSLSNLPDLTVLAVASVSPTFTVVPGRIDLAQGPLSTGQVAYISIFYNGTNPVALSEPRTGESGVEASLKEFKPGAGFTAVVSFPAGFQLPPGKSTFRARTSHPQCPVIEVPIFQTPDPVPAAPVLNRTPLEVVTAPLPLVFQTQALTTLKLGPEQQEAFGQLRKRFIEEIGGLSQDPMDPAYLAKWRKARPGIDALLVGEVGSRALMRLAPEPPADETAQAP